MSFLSKLKPSWGRKRSTRKSSAARRELAATPVEPPAAEPAQPALVNPLTPTRVTTPSRRWSLPRFRTTASDHLSQEQRDALGRQRIRLRNAFTPSQPVTDPQMFAGRQELLETIIRSVEDRRLHVVIYGDRGMGKTSMLRMLELAAEDARYIVIYLSCGAQSEFDEMFRAAAVEIPLLFHSTVSPNSTNSQAGCTVADLLGPEKVTPRRFADTVSRLIGTRVIIILDEFDRSQSPAFRRDVAELIKTLSDMSARVQLVIGGVAADLADLIEQIPSIRRSIAVARVHPMTEDETLGIIANGERVSGLKFEDGANALLLSATNGSPYLANLLAHAAGMRALEEQRQTVTQLDMQRSIDGALTDLRERLPPEIVARLDQEPPQKTKSASATPRSGTLSSTEISRLLQKFEAEGLLHPSQTARYALIVDTLAPYFQLAVARSTQERPQPEPARAAARAAE